MSRRHLTDTQLCAYLDTPGRGPEARHLSGCAECRHRLAQFEQVLNVATAVPAPAWDPRRGQALRCRTRRALFAPRNRGVGWRRYLAAAVAGALGAWALAAHLHPRQEAAPGILEAASRPPVAVSDTVGGDLEEEVWVSWIDEYLIDTASDAELFEQLQAVSDDDYALLAQ